MLLIQRLVFITLLFGLLSCQWMQNDIGVCSNFEYSNDILENAIVPVLKKEVGDGYIYFKFDDPVFFYEKDSVDIYITSGRVVDGRYAMSEISYMFTYDCMKDIVISYYELYKKINGVRVIDF